MSRALIAVMMNIMLDSVEKSQLMHYDPAVFPLDECKVRINPAGVAVVCLFLELLEGTLKDKVSF